MMMSAPWKNTLELAQKLGEDVDEDNKKRMDDYANNWYCCAVGEKLQLPPASTDDSLTNLSDAILDADVELINKGGQFSADVSNGRYDFALGTMEHIHKLMTPDVITKIQKQYITLQRKRRRVLLETGDLPSDDMKVEGSGVYFD